jgi:hypothetical protein
MFPPLISVKAVDAVEEEVVMGEEAEAEEKAEVGTYI